MDLINRETFNRWTQKNGWMQINEALTPSGRQYTYITPAGMLVIAQIDIKGNLTSIGQLVPAPQGPPILPERKG